MAACSCLQLQRVEAPLCCSAWPSHGSGVSGSGTQALCVWASAVAPCGISGCTCRLWSTGSVVVAHGLSRMWDLPEPGIEPMSLALQGGFLTTGSPGKPWAGRFKCLISNR